MAVFALSEPLWEIAQFRNATVSHCGFPRPIPKSVQCTHRFRCFRA